MPAGSWVPRQSRKTIQATSALASAPPMATD
jgi:hypothetical protein